MVGWIVASNRYVEEGMVQISNTEYSFRYKNNGKFINDKICVDENDIFILLDGVIFNKRELIDEAGGKEWEKTFKEGYIKDGAEYIKRLRGTFNGVVLYKGSKRVVSFVDQLGERPIFYFGDSQNNLISSDFNCLIDTVKSKKKYNFDKIAVKNMLYFGYMVDNRTYIEEIKRLFPGNVLIIDQEGMREEIYFRFSNKNQITVSEAEAIELIDNAFNAAMKREFDKDKEYNYKSLVDISGGLDARTVCFAAKKLGYGNITNLCYSQLNAYEKQITEKLVEKLGNDYIFRSLNNASFIFRVDEIVKENYGLGYFAGITGGRDFLKILNPTQFGIEHTGLLGDVYEGSFNEQAVYEKPYINSRYRFSKLLDMDIDESFLELYEDNELFGFYTRGILGGASTHIIRQKYFETYSPFEDVDFLNLMFSLPLKQRIEEKIYLKWVMEKYPESLDIKYAKTMCKVNSSKFKIKVRAAINIANIKIVLPLMKKMRSGRENNYKGTMNPFEYWYENNLELRKFVENYYKSTINLVDVDIRKYLVTMMEKGNTIDKMIMLTILSVYKQYG